MPDRPKTLHDDAVSTAYGLLVNICTVFHTIPAIALFYGTTTLQWARPHHCRDFTITSRHPPTHTHTHRHSVELLWTSDQPVAETSTWQHTTPTRERHPCPCGIRTRSLSKRAVADPRLRPRGEWDRLVAHNVCH